jgi:pilus assembly protein CpaB
MNTIVMLLIAILFGAGAVFFANSWVATQQQAQNTTTTAPAADMGTIVVAARDYTFGEALAPELLREIPWPRASVPEGAFATIAELNKDGKRVALTSISTNEPILKWKISGPGARASLSATVKEGMRAVAVRVNDVVGVGGFVLPGDRVDVLYTRKGSGEDYSSTDILIQNVRVLAVDQMADQKKDVPVVAKVATLEVTTTDAQKLALAQTTGSIGLTLRAAGSLDQAPAQRVVEQELVSSPSVYMDAINARKEVQDALDARLKQFEGSLAAAGQTDEALKKQLENLEGALKQTAQETGEGEKALRAKLAGLESAIRDAGKSTGAELRSKLSDLEKALQNLRDTPPVQTIAVQQVATTVEEVGDTSLNKTIGVTRGVRRDVYEVPEDPYE